MHLALVALNWKKRATQRCPSRFPKPQLGPLVLKVIPGSIPGIAGYSALLLRSRKLMGQAYAVLRSAKGFPTKGRSFFTNLVLVMYFNHELRKTKGSEGLCRNPQAQAPKYR
jgi:hypothetical protein